MPNALCQKSTALCFAPRWQAGIPPEAIRHFLDSDVASDSTIIPPPPMTPAANRTYRTAAFAALAGVTSRALHHYDRLGLLRPKRSSAGYRMYSERDLETDDRTH